MLAHDPDLVYSDVPPVLDAKTIQKLLGCSRPTAYEAMAAMRPIRIGRLVRVSRANFLAWLEASAGGTR